MRSLAVLGFALAACAAQSSAQREQQPWADTPLAPAPVRAAPATEAVQPAPAPAPPKAAPAAQPEPAAAELARLLETNPQAWAARFPRGLDCEGAARTARATNANLAWRGLNACVQKADFKSLRRLTDGFWDSDLQTRPDAPQLIGAFIAARGGDLASDLAILRRRRVPLFSLETASAQPEIYRGKVIAFLGRVDDLEKASRGKAVARLMEVALVSRDLGDTVTHKYAVKSEVDDHGRRYVARREYLGAEVTSHDRNDLEETGLPVRAELARLDPFFVPGGTFVVVARFDGMNVDEDALEGRHAIVTVLAYYTIGKESFLD